MLFVNLGRLCCRRRLGGFLAILQNECAWAHSAPNKTPVRRMVMLELVCVCLERKLEVSNKQVPGNARLALQLMSDEQEAGPSVQLKLEIGSTSAPSPSCSHFDPGSWQAVPAIFQPLVPSHSQMA